jgi:hypothetical protein
VRRLVIAGDGPEVEELTGFDEGPMRDDWAEQLDRRGIEVTSGVLRAEAVEVFRAYGDRTDAVVYNAQGSGAIRDTDLSTGVDNPVHGSN